MCSDKQINDLVDMLDKLMSEGSGHVNVTADDLADSENQPQVFTGRSLDCSDNSMACAVPTIHKGFDE